MVRHKNKQRGIAYFELLGISLFLFGIIWSVVHISKLYWLQDRLHLAVSTVGALAADIPPQNWANRRYEAILCDKSDANLRYDECPDSIASEFLYQAAVSTLGADYEDKFAMRFEFVSSPHIAQSDEFAVSDTIGVGQCDLYPFVPGGVRINNYLTHPSATDSVDLKNRAHHQFIYMAMCIEPLGVTGSIARLVNKPLFADSMSLRRYWYDGDYIE